MSHLRMSVKWNGLETREGLSFEVIETVIGWCVRVTSIADGSFGDSAPRLSEERAQADLQAARRSYAAHLSAHGQTIVDWHVIDPSHKRSS